MKCSKKDNLNLNKISVRNSGTLGNFECAVKLVKCLQHISFRKQYKWWDSWCLSGVVICNKHKNGN